MNLTRSIAEPLGHRYSCFPSIHDRFALGLQLIRRHGCTAFLVSPDFEDGTAVHRSGPQQRPVIGPVLELYDSPIVCRVVTRAWVLVGVKQSRTARHLGGSRGDVDNRPLPLIIRLIRSGAAFDQNMVRDRISPDFSILGDSGPAAFR